MYRTDISSSSVCLTKFSNLRLFRSKGALLLLLWLFTGFFNLFYTSVIPFFYTYEMLVGASIAVSVPIALLADIYIGRYTVLHYSMRLQWISVIASDAFLAIKEYVFEGEALSYVLLVLAVTGLAGSVGVVVNSLQFGMDQLTFASTREITSYISWSVCSTALGTSMGFIFGYCNFYSYSTLPYFTVPLLCTLCVLTDFFLNHWLVKEPTTSNPLKLICQVLKYAWKNKKPQLRSAFTYCQDKPYTRIDLGKSKYGGPFSTEQVEDVKSFFKIVFIFITFYAPAIVLLSCLDNFLDYQIINHRITYQLSPQASINNYIKTCYDAFIPSLEYPSIVLLVPVVEFFLYPLLTKLTCCRKFGILAKAQLGIVILILFCLYNVGMEFTFTKYLDHYNATCLINGLETPIFNHWAIPPKVLCGLAMYIFATSLLEFIAAQSPYSMRGILLGICFALVAPSLTIYVVFDKMVVKAKNSAGLYGGSNCSLWVYSFLVGVTMAAFCVTFLIKKCYTPRQREDILPNEQIFATNYYDKYLPQVS